MAKTKHATRQEVSIILSLAYLSLINSAAFAQEATKHLDREKPTSSIQEAPHNKNRTKKSYAEQARLYAAEHYPPGDFGIDPRLQRFLEQLEGLKMEVAPM